MMVSSAFCKLNSFGSYRLGVHSPGTDIDLLVVGPSCVGREEHFFGKEKSHFKKSLYQILKDHQLTKSITPVPYTQVPVIKICFDGIDFDILYARLGNKIIDEKIDLHDDNLLKSVDAQSIYSLNGV